MRASIAALVLFLAALFGAAVASAEVPPSSAAAREILVMLRLPPPHYRPGANYGGSYTDSAGSAARRRIAESLAREQGLEVLSGWPMPAIGVDCYVLRAPPGANLDDVLRRLSQDRRAEWAQPMNLFRARAAESGTAAKASLYPLQPSAKLWRLDEMHRVSTGRGVRVAVIDSGADAAHPDLIGRIEVERNFVDTREHTAEVHGTAVAGIIGARGDDAAIERGASVVGAVDADAADGGFPASHRGVLAVSDRAGAASASILYVPGADVPAPAPGGRWNFVTGASFAAAQIAGFIALVREVSPAPAMRQSAAWVRFPPSSPDGAAGYVDACATLQRSVPSLNCASARAGTARVSR